MKMNIHRKIGLTKLLVCISAAATVALHLPSGHLTFSLLVLMVLSTMLAGLGAADAVVNDLLPENYEAPRAEQWKYLVFVGLAGCQMSLLYAAVIADRLDWHSFRYAVDAAVAVGAAVLDLKSRYIPGHRNEQNHLPDQAS